MFADDNAVLKFEVNESLDGEAAASAQMVEVEILPPVDPSNKRNETIYSKGSNGRVAKGAAKKHIGWPRKGLADVSFCCRINL